MSDRGVSAVSRSVFLYSAVDRRLGVACTDSMPHQSHICHSLPHCHRCEDAAETHLQHHHHHFLPLQIQSQSISCLISVAPLSHSKQEQATLCVSFTRWLQKGVPSSGYVRGCRRRFGEIAVPDGDADREVTWTRSALLYSVRVTTSSRCIGPP